MSWGPARRPKIRYGSVSSPIRDEGSDGDIRIEETNLGAKLFGKIGGTWYGSPMAVTEGTPITRIGTTISDHLVVSPDKLEFMKNSKSMLSITSTGDINMTGKIIITSIGSINVVMGSSSCSDIGTANVVLGIDAGTALVAGSENNVFIGKDAGGGGWTGALSSYNIGIGVSALGLGAMNGAIGNTAMGYAALNVVTEGNYNTAIGYLAGDGMTGGNHYNTAMGSGATNAGMIHWNEQRKMTIKELKRITSLPDDFKLTGTFNQQAERCGRMVPCLMMKAIGDSIYNEVLSKL